MGGRAVEVADIVDAAIVLAGLIRKLDPDPLADLEVGLADEAHDAAATVLEADGLPRLVLGHEARSGVRQPHRARLPTAVRAQFFSMLPPFEPTC